MVIFSIADESEPTFLPDLTTSILGSGGHHTNGDRDMEKLRPPRGFHCDSFLLSLLFPLAYSGNSLPTAIVGSC